MNGAKRIERNMMASDGRRDIVVHGTWYRIEPKLRKKQRIAARRRNGGAR